MDIHSWNFTSLYKYLKLYKYTNLFLYSLHSKIFIYLSFLEIETIYILLIGKNVPSLCLRKTLRCFSVHVMSCLWIVLLKILLFICLSANNCQLWNVHLRNVPTPFNLLVNNKLNKKSYSDGLLTEIIKLRLLGNFSSSFIYFFITLNPKSAFLNLLCLLLDVV